MQSLSLGSFAIALLAFIGPAHAQDARIAVAANFTAPAQELAAAFAAETGQQIGFSFGATGPFYAQITQGAPFDALLSADAVTPTQLLSDGFGVAGSDFTYAVGKLVLFSVEPDRVTGPEALDGDFARLAIAEPATAPYGTAAVDVITALGLTQALDGRLVVGQNISQTYQFVETGNAELGFVALSQVIGRTDGSHWVVDPDLYSPITQNALLLSPDNVAATQFLEFLTSETGSDIIASYGYGRDGQ